MVGSSINTVGVILTPQFLLCKVAQTKFSMVNTRNHFGVWSIRFFVLFNSLLYLDLYQNKLLVSGGLGLLELACLL